MRMLLLVIGLLAVNVTPALAGRCVSGNCTEGEGIYLYDDLKRYEGEFHNATADGTGTIHYPAGAWYEGDVYDGRPHGNGTLHGWRGWKHKGSFHHGWEHGDGIFTDRDGARFHGTFAGGYRHGPALRVEPDGSVVRELWINGRFVRRLKHGEQPTELEWNGTLPAPPKVPWDPKYPTGCLSGDCTDGTGVYVFDTGQRYEGEFREGRSFGQGTRYFPNGDVYEGEEVNGTRHGEGIYHFADGDVFMGRFESDMREGPGAFRQAEGFLFVVAYKSGQRHGPGTVHYPDGTVRHALWEEGGFVRYLDEDEFRELKKRQMRERNRAFPSGQPEQHGAQDNATRAASADNATVGAVAPAPGNATSSDAEATSRSGPE